MRITLRSEILVLVVLCAVSSSAAATYTARTLQSQFPNPAVVVVYAATQTPAGVEIVGSGRNLNGTDATPIRFPTPTAAVQLMNPPPSDSRYGIVAAVANTSIGVVEAGQYYRLQAGGTGRTHAVVWNNSPDSAVDLHVVSNTEALSNSSAVYGISSLPSGFNAAGVLTSGDGKANACAWTATSLTSANVASLHDNVIMAESRTFGAYTFQGVGKQVGFSYDRVAGGGTTQPRARVWSGTAESTHDLTPAGYLYGVINTGSGDDAQELLAGHVGHTFLEQLPALWTGTGGSFRTLSVTASRPGGSVVYVSQSAAAGFLVINGAGGGQRAAVWDLASGQVTDLHNFLPPEFQGGSAYSNAMYVDAIGNVYGNASISSGGSSVPVVWMVPEPATLPIAALLVGALRTRRRRD